jgi:HTH-type transcriptional regulator/antitoxin MqsA
MKKCPACGGGPPKRATREMAFDYKNQTLTYDQPGLWCDDCGEALLEPSDKETTDPIIFDFMAKVDRRLTTGDIRRIRKKLGLTQMQAGEIIGGGANAFHRYETGKAYPAKGSENFLRLLDRHPRLVSELMPEEAA